MKVVTLLSAVGVLFTPFITYAHEVYVLSTDTVTGVMGAEHPNPFLAYLGNEYQFYFWGFVCFVVFSTIIAASLFRVFEKPLDPILFALKKYALPVARVTVGLTFVAFSISGNLFGSEIFLTDGYGALAPLMQGVLFVIGVLATLGLSTRAAGLGMLAIYVSALFIYGPYVLTYTDYLGVALLITILGGGLYSVDNWLKREPFHRLAEHFEYLRPYAFALLRICFGWGVLYASVYAKFIYSGLALQVVNQYDLTRFFPFDPLFVVLGALIIEFIAGLMLFFGVAIRWTILFLSVWLTLSLLYFQEMIWPHGILFGLAISLFLHGYDRYSVEGFLMKKRGKEPVF